MTTLEPTRAVSVTVRAEHREQTIDAVFDLIARALSERAADPHAAERQRAFMARWRAVLDRLAEPGIHEVTAPAADLARLADVLQNRGAAALILDVFTTSGGQQQRPAPVLRRQLACWRAGDLIRAQLEDTGRAAASYMNHEQPGADRAGEES